MLASLADKNGLIGAEQICAGMKIDLEGLEGVPDVLFFLAIEHRKLIDRVWAQASMSRRTGGKYWSTFQFKDDALVWSLDSAAARNEFVTDTIAILDLTPQSQVHRGLDRTIRIDPITEEETTLTQATIYVEERAESELGFGQSETLERHVVPKVLEVGVACDPKARIVEVLRARR